MAKTQPPASKSSDPTPDPVIRQSGGIPSLRWFICGLLFLATMINYIDRGIIGILKSDLSRQLNWTEKGYGYIVAAFQLAYAFGYLLSGRMIDWIGVKRGFPLVAGLWSLACAGHAFVRSMFGFGVARVALGLSEGGNFPAAIKTVTEWFPTKERALATGIFNSASNIGAIVCPIAVPVIADRFGWQAAFIITGAMGLVWIVAWNFFYESPSKHRWITQEERELLADVTPSSPATETAVPWSALLKRPAAWGYMAAQMVSGPVWWFYLFWMPDFIQKQFHMTKTDAGHYVGLAYGISIVGSVFGGALSMKLLNAGWKHNAARKGALLVCALAVLPVFFAPLAATPLMATLVVGLAMAAHQGWSANLYTVVSDIIPKRAVSSVVGLGGFASGIAGMLVSAGVGELLQAKVGYTPIFAWASTMYLIGLFILHLCIPKIDPANQEFASAA